MNVTAAAALPISSVVVPECPLNSGRAILDQLLAVLGRNQDLAGLDAALDVRLALARKAAPAVVLAEFFRMRAIVEEQHYLACYRFRRWLDAHYVARVQWDRCQPAAIVPLHLADASSFAALCDQCAEAAGAKGAVRSWTRVHFAHAAAGSA